MPKPNFYISNINIPKNVPASLPLHWYALFLFTKTGKNAASVNADVLTAYKSSVTLPLHSPSRPFLQSGGDAAHASTASTPPSTCGALPPA